MDRHQNRPQPPEPHHTQSPRTRMIHWRWSTQFLHTLGTFGHPIHAWLAALWCLGCSGPAFAVELLALPLYVATLARLPFVWRAARDACTQPALIAIFAFWLWTACTAAWSADPAGARHELEYVRWVPVVMTLWAILDRRNLLIAALCVGFAIAQIAQLAEFIALRQGIELFSHPPAPDPLARVSGWWHQPAMGGAVLVIAAALHLGPALFASGWRRWTGLAGLAASLLGILATGTRGSLLSAACLLLIALAARAWWAFKQRTKASRTPLIALAALIMLASGAVASPLGVGLRDRARLAHTQLSRALHDRDFDSDMGGRLVAAMSALDAARQHPLQGIGAGDFLSHTEDYVQRENLNIAPWRVDKLRTAHNTYLHTLATTGVIGLALLLTIFALALRGASLELRTLGPAALARYASAPFVALLALAIVACFETIHLNMSSAAVATTLVALSPNIRFGAARIDRSI